MKRIVVCLMILMLGLMANSQQLFTIKGKIKKSKTKKVWIYNLDKSISDTVSLNFFKKFNYSNTTSTSEMIFVKPLEAEVPILLKIDSTSRIKLKTKLPQTQLNLKISGSEESEIANEFFYQMSQYKNRVSENEKKLYKDETADGQYYYDSVINSISEQSKEYLREFVIANKTNPFVVVALEFIDYDTDYEELIYLEQGMRGVYKNSSLYEKVQKSIYKYEMRQVKVDQVGQEAPILILPGVDGNDVSMSDLKGNYILIDFWASWCGPCRAEHPRLTRLYNKYQEKGFAIYSISLDKNKTKWLKAIEKDKLVWAHHVSNLKMFDSPAVEIYGVKSLPFNVLIDEQGTVLAFNLKGQKLENKLNEIFNENN